MEQLRLRILTLSLLCIALVACGSTGTPEPEPEQDPALVAACHFITGAGQAATGGSGGTVFHVTRLDDSINPDDGKAEEGTLRYAVEQGDVRTVLFDTAGTIHLSKPLEIRKANITIAGQSAPGQGICLADYPLIVSADNVIIRFLRVRLGTVGTVASGKEYDAVSVNGTDQVVLDHLSCSWSIDECVSCYGNTRFTMQYCFVTESLRASKHAKGNHGYGGIWGGENVSFHHNLLAHHDSRNPRFDHDFVDRKAGPIDYVNNVIYNWGGNSTYGGEGTTKGGGARKVNMLANYYRPGPATGSNVRQRLLNPWASCDNCTSACGGTVEPIRVYLAGNTMVGAEAVTADNWQGVNYSGGATEARCRAAEPYSFTGSLTAPQTADEAFETVLQKAGCSLVRDAIDARIAEEVRQGTAACKGSNGSTGGLIDDPADAGGWPVLTGVPQKDTDADGIPDAWEEAHGLNPRSFKDGKESTLVTGFTNLDVYLCDIVKHLY